MRGTQFVAGRSVRTVGGHIDNILPTDCRQYNMYGSRHEHACHALFGPHVQLHNPYRNHLEMDPDRIWIGQMHMDALKLDLIWFNAHWVSSVDRPLLVSLFYFHVTSALQLL